MSTIPCFDFHMHTHYLGCANGTMTIPEIAKECERLGVAEFGITDHLNTLEKLPLHEPIKRDLAALETPLKVHFGVELNYLGVDGDFAFNADIKEKMGFAYVIGGIHATYLEAYDLEKIIEIQHRHHLKTCADPLVDVLVHPYWFSRGEFDRKGWPWVDTMKPVPERFARELGRAARETGTAIEINGGANFRNRKERYVEEYTAFLAILAEEGCRFALGSDAHAIGQLADIRHSWQAAERLGLTPDRIWRPGA